jgi:hypothetical protein
LTLLIFPVCVCMYVYIYRPWHSSICRYGFYSRGIILFIFVLIFWSCKIEFVILRAACTFLMFVYTPSGLWLCLTEDTISTQQIVLKYTITCCLPLFTSCTVVYICVVTWFGSYSERS